jgi:hypothetical protein
MKILERLEKLAFSLVLVILPWQLRDVLAAYQAGGYFSEYRSISLFGADLALVFLALAWLLRRWIQKKPFKFLPYSLLGFLPGLFGLISLAFSIDRTLTWDFSVQFLVAGILFFYLAEEFKTLKEIIWPLVIGVVIQLVVGLTQFLTGHSAGLFFLRESHLNASSQDNVVVDFLGLRRLRAYGLTSHPNLLGAWAAVSAFVLSFSQSVWGQLGLVLAIILALLTFSKAALVMLVISLVITWPWRKNAWLWLAALVVGSLLLLPGWQSRFNFNIPKEQRSIEERLVGDVQALHIIKDVLPQGTGGGDYLVKLNQLAPDQPAWSYQPVHNIFLLSVAELGVLGVLWWLILWLAFFMASWRFRFSWPAWSLLALTLIPALTDHFLWSMQEGRLLLMFVLGVAFTLTLNKTRL